MVVPSPRVCFHAVTTLACPLSIRSPLKVVGFDKTLLSVEDVDFGLRLRAHGKKLGKKYVTLRRCRVTTTCRKFDQFGDWYLVKNRNMVRRIFSETDRAATDEFYYRTGR